MAQAKTLITTTGNKPTIKVAAMLTIRMENKLTIGAAVTPITIMASKPTTEVAAMHTMPTESRRITEVVAILTTTMANRPTHDHLVGFMIKTAKVLLKKVFQ